MSQIAEYDKYLNDKMQEIRDRLSGGKVSLDVSQLGVKSRKGKTKNKLNTYKFEIVGISERVMYNYRSGRNGIEKQRLYTLLYSLPLEIFEDLQKIIK